MLGFGLGPGHRVPRRPAVWQGGSGSAVRPRALAGCRAPAGPRSCPPRAAAARQYKPLPTELQNWGFYRLVLVYTMGFCLTNGEHPHPLSLTLPPSPSRSPSPTLILTSR